MFQNPSTIGRYKVIGELGRGSMGIVYLAEDPALKREVAIKLVHRGQATQDDVLARFRQEAEISARLNHPNVIMVFDVGEEKDFGPFMAMEYADGEVLAEVLNRGPMEPERTALILIQAFHALQAAHGLGIVHRDFKPENLILTRSGRLKLMDFGIARHENPLLTGSGVLCTPSFAAPEILDRRPPGPATDNWAFCVTACLMVTGELPFKTDSISSLLYAIAHDPPVFPNTLQPALRVVFTKALEKDPEARYLDLRAFMLDLLNALPLDPEARSRCLMMLDASESAGEGATKRLLRLPAYGFIPRVWVIWATGIAALLVFLGAWFALHPRSRKITLSSTPSDARVFLDGQLLGTTPLVDARISSKAKTIRLEKEGFQPLDRSIQPGERTLTLTLTALPTVMNIESTPEGAEVFVNNLLMGITPIRGLQVAGGKPIHLQIRKAGYETWNATIPAGASAPKTIQLRKLDPPKKSFWKRLFNGK